MGHKISAVLAIAAAGALGSSASAQLVTLEDHNSLAHFDIGSQTGQDAWVVNGVDHMFQQWFWFRAGGDTAERSIDTLVPGGFNVTDTNPFSDPRPDTLGAQWFDQAQRFRLELNVTLRGGTSGTFSDITEQIRITNQQTFPLPFTFFQYVDFDLNNSVGDDLVSITGGNTAHQSEGLLAVSETVVTPLPSALEVNLFAVTRNSLNDLAITNLNGNAGPLGPGDLTWAFQWNFVLNPGQTVLISKDKSLVPSPSSLALLALGGLLMSRRRR